MLGTSPLTHPTPAIWRVSHRWLTAIGCALVPVLFTAAGSAIGQVVGADEAVAALLIAAGATLSAIVGILVMRASRQPYREYGFRAPRNLRAAWWLLPPVATIVLIASTGSAAPPLGTSLAYLLLAVVVAVNEEVWFRGAILAVLRPAGLRTTVVASSALFGILHLANLASGASPVMTLLQVAFATLFGLVTVEVVVLTGSLWPTIGWHLAWNLTSYLGGNGSTPLALAGVGLACVVMLVYAVALWRRVLSMAD